MLWWYLERKTDFFQSAGARMLHFAPEPFFEPRFRQAIGSGYMTADLFNPADVRVDVTNIQFPDNTFDIVYCSHVLEHVPADRQAMRELCRVLKPDGWAIIMVPVIVERTEEDLSITDPQERLRLYGQSDHVRNYGFDFVDRLREAGFDVSGTGPEDFLTADEIKRIAARQRLTGDVYYCTKVRKPR
jgi:SAM-dependent methyltransferase